MHIVLWTYNAQVCMYSITDLIISQCVEFVELTFFESEFGRFLMKPFLKWSFEIYCNLKVKVKADSMQMRAVLVLSRLLDTYYKKSIHLALSDGQFYPFTQASVLVERKCKWDLMLHVKYFFWLKNLHILSTCSVFDKLSTQIGIVRLPCCLLYLTAACPIHGN